VNHFPRSHELTRKDNMVFNMRKLKQRFPKNNFSFMPESYVLPDEFQQFSDSHEAMKPKKPK